MATPGARLRAFMEARYASLGLGKRYGFVIGMERLSGVKRATLNGWFQRSSTPRLDALGEVARVLQVDRSVLVAVFDGQDPEEGLAIPEVITEAERRRRRKWWLRVARETTPLDLGTANDAMAAAGHRSTKGQLVSLWETFQSRLEPTSAAQLRSLAEIYRVPARSFIELWNNPPRTDEEMLAELRGVRIEEVAPVVQERPARTRKQAS